MILKDLVAKISDLPVQYQRWNAIGINIQILYLNPTSNSCLILSSLSLDYKYSTLNLYVSYNFE
jgi:hypothetical protein